ncbi:interleukin-23 subunit alpha-like isoform X1 [Stegostoma tigrinum]|uniref:interleukin-23 subunit alpha-like isoform X1 n=1 Tax=Stegostoma tigrinum TaxID=3053191 RepID=UPI00202B4CEB|nr:interleukin-23 subunit alpha-like isoform X1 [Stegostoma tigrinum]
MERCGELLTLILLLNVAGITGSVPEQLHSWTSCRILSRNLTAKTFNYTHRWEHCPRNFKLNDSEDIPRIEVSDSCDPVTLRTVPEMCLKKIKEGLSYYHNQFSQLGNVKESIHNSDIRKFAHNLSKIILDLLKSIKSSDSSADDRTTDRVAADNGHVEIHEIRDWELNCTLFRTLERFQSFSSLVARVFGHPSGNPSEHHNTGDCGV